MNETTGTANDGAAVADAIRRDLALEPGLQKFATGSVPVFVIGEHHVVKLFPPAERSHFDAEWAALTRVDGHLPVPTPRPIARGERDGWLYVVMMRLAGVSLAETWPAIEGSNRVALMRELGAALSALHTLATEGLAPLAVDWPQFIGAQRASARARQATRKLGSPWLEQVDDFLARWTPADDGARALLHTEVMREHLLVERRAHGWRLSGLFDFEPAMVGAPGYELASIGIFTACAEPGMLRAFLDAYDAKPDDELPLRIMAWALLHRYSHLPWYLERLSVPDDVRDLESLARRWFTP